MTRPEAANLLMYLNLGYGLYVTSDSIEKKELCTICHDMLEGIKAEHQECRAAIDWYFSQPFEKPKAINGNLIKFIVLKKRQLDFKPKKQDDRPRESTQEELEEGLAWFYEQYVIGGATWSHARAGCAWISKHLSLDTEPFIARATQRVMTDQVDQRRAIGLVALVGQKAAHSAVADEAARIAVTQHFKEKYLNANRTV